MRTICAAITLTIVAGTSAPSTAATADGDFAVYGWGARDCTAITSVLEGDQAAQAQAQLAEWISGYVTSQNRSEDGVYDMTPVKTHYPLVSLARNICANNSDQLFESVVNAMIDSFSTLRLPENSPTVSVNHKEQSVTVNESTVLRVQEFLVSADLLENGSADGVFGPRTAQALESWQEAAGLQPNGLPDMVTLFLMAQQIDQ